MTIEQWLEEQKQLCEAQNETVAQEIASIACMASRLPHALRIIEALLAASCCESCREDNAEIAERIINEK